MKRVFTILILLVTALCCNAHSTDKNTIKFMGHPVDGSKTRMRIHLLKNGFTYNKYTDYYIGSFNGYTVRVGISTYKKKVDRIHVTFEYTDELNIRYDYNNLIKQFNKNNKYISFIENKLISQNEDISNEITKNNGRFYAEYFYKPQIDSLESVENLKEELIRRYTNEQLEEILTGHVWFIISKINNAYMIELFYDNLNNRPKGEDL
ncbi:MAG: hypothetical protein IKD40_04040 [Bacteroidaceae bacterium]|nr:hypothetical protein [Bacteroidaceae bacterium]